MLFIDKIRYITGLKDSCHRIAFSFSAGVFIGISPFLGFHTLLGVILSWLFRLNTFATISGIYLLPLWSLIPIYVFSTWVGSEFFGSENLLLSFLFGTFLIGLLSAILCYLCIYVAIKRNMMRGYRFI
ncbi:MAG: DUF2062 domain-containing protein [Thermodesulfovibrionales bacterium]